MGMFSKATPKADCDRCPEPIDRSKPHVSYSRNVETQRGRTVTVREADEVATRHLGCDGGR